MINGVPEILVILENAWSSSGGTMKNPVYPGSPRYINVKNATYSRILNYLDEYFIYFADTTPILAKNSKEKLKPDLKWVKRAIEFKEWDAIITCSAVATKCLNELHIETFANLPHPTSFAWRKQFIIDVKEKLNQKFNII